jgi:hypothetical protein
MRPRISPSAMVTVRFWRITGTRCMWISIPRRAVPTRFTGKAFYSPGALQGYLIDKKTADQYQITHIDQLKDPKLAKLFDTNGDGKADLAGWQSGWGCEKVIEHQLDAFKLRDAVTHNQGSYSAIIADTITRFKKGEPVLYYTWTPYWVSGVMVPGKDVVWLQVPFSSLPGERKGCGYDAAKRPELRFPGQQSTDHRQPEVCTGKSRRRQTVLEISARQPHAMNPTPQKTFETRCHWLLLGWLTAGAAQAAVYPLPRPDTDVIGQVKVMYATKDDTLVDIARRYGLGYDEIVHANPGVDRWAPGEGNAYRTADPLHPARYSARRDHPQHRGNADVLLPQSQRQRRTERWSTLSGQHWPNGLENADGLDQGRRQGC